MSNGPQPLDADLVRRNLERVRERIRSAAADCGRSEDQVTLVAITKYATAADARVLVDAGCSHLGESRPQVLWDKAGQLANTGAVWHLVGHLQRNKVRRTLQTAGLAWIQSVDSLRLLSALDTEAERWQAAESGDRPQVLLEVNISGDTSKHGFAPDEMNKVMETAWGSRRLEVRGLMGMASREGGARRAESDFAALAQLFHEQRERAPSKQVFDQLSMGMSGDLEAAIAAGSTMVRVGSALFEP